MADHETLEESLDFAFVSKDGKFVGNRDAVLKYNQENPATPPDPSKGWGLPWAHDKEKGLSTRNENWVPSNGFRRLYRAFASLDEASQREFLMRVEDE